MSRRGGAQILVAPGAQLQLVGQVDAGRGSRAFERLHHEKPAEDLEAGLAEDGGVGA